METEKDETDRLNADVPKKKISLDTILIEAVGQFGLYQFRMILLAGVLGVFTAFSAMEYVFTAGRISTRVQRCLRISHRCYSVFCGLALLSGALVFLSPETLGTKIPDTMEEAALIGAKKTELRF